jgi:uncharacterized membrane protein YkvA (DUF1232 family)
MRELLRVLPELARLLGRLVADPALPRGARIALAAAAAYLLSPIDLIPDFVPVVGVLDDALLAAVIVDGLLNHVDRQLLLKYWPWDESVLDRVGRVAGWLSVWVPRRVKTRIFASR